MKRKVVEKKYQALLDGMYAGYAAERDPEQVAEAVGHRRRAEAEQELPPAGEPQAAAGEERDRRADREQPDALAPR